eukprot:SAG11_NODE_696_length_7693_cov_9.962339_9_plen_154_part_00
MKGLPSLAGHGCPRYISRYKRRAQGTPSSLPPHEPDCQCTHRVFTMYAQTVAQRQMKSGRDATRAEWSGYHGDTNGSDRIENVLEGARDDACAQNNAVVVQAARCITPDQCGELPRLVYRRATCCSGPGGTPLSTGSLATPSIEKVFPVPVWP